tara:strand:- start:122 stop:2509 length:2388 start_codon:yes stop_codon:yes gene_type:complete
MVFSNNLLMGAAGQATGYEIDQSIRFNNDDSPVMSRSFGTPTDRDKFTYAFWVKSTNQANGYALGINVTGGVTFAGMVFNGGNMAFYDYTSGSANIDVRSTFTSNVGKFRDYSAWYHAVFAYDSDQGTAANRLKFYINGVQFPSASLVGPSGGSPVFPSSGFDSKFNASGTTHTISDNVNGKLDGYMAEIYFIDGQALDPTSFGEFNTSGVFVPIAYSGAFGDNGFFIDGRDSSDLGDDESGNGNDFSTSGLAANDQKPDTPTLNASIFNALWAGATLSDGNLVATATGNNYQWAISTFAVDDGNKHVVEFQKSAGTFGYVGLYQLGNHTATTGNNYFYGYNLGTGEIIKNSSIVTDLGTGAANSLMRIEYDSSTDAIKIFDDGAEIFPASTGVSNTVGLTGHNSLHFGCAPYASGTIITATFQGLSGTPTAGFKELTSANLPTPAISDGSKYFQTTLYEGNGSTQSINQSGNSTFQPDWVWIKNRDAADSHVLTDSPRGVTKILSTNNTDAETTDADTVTAFESDGFALGDDDKVNTSSESYVAWQWHTQGAAGSSNTDGSINTTTTSLNATAGLSISTYTGTGSNATVGHGLGVAPSMIIAHRRDGTGSWRVYNKNLTDASYVLNMESTGAQEVSATVWNSTAPTSTVFSIGTNAEVNADGGTYVAYCFAEIEGYSKFGSYEGNGNADGSFVYTGFQPAYLFLKNIDAAESYNLRDSKRDLFNTTRQILASNTTAAEATSGGGQFVDLLSNGFKLRGTDPGINSSATFIYMAFAKNPFGGSGIAPATGGFITG